MTTDEAIKNLTLSQKVKYHARFQTFEIFQMLSLYRQQYKLAKELERMEGKGYFGRGTNDNEAAVSDFSSQWSDAEKMLTTLLFVLRLSSYSSS